MRSRAWRPSVCERPPRGVAGAGRAVRAAVAGSLLALSISAALAVPAGAATTFGASQIVVQGDGAGAVINRAPFGIAFTDAGGRTVLAESAAGAPVTLPEPMPGSAAEPSGPANYGPLSFLVGTDSPATIMNYSPSGNLASVHESGTEYSATEVLQALPEGEGALLTLATDDPSGRRLLAHIQPQAGGTIRVRAEPADPAGVAAMADSFASSAGEAFRGFGGRHNSLDQHGQDFYNWVDQENIRPGSPGEGPGVMNLSPNGPQAAYYVQSSFISSAGYGFLLDRNELSRWRMDSDGADAWQVQVAAPAIDYVVAPGAPPQAIAAITAISGRQRVPPSWAIGPIFDQGVEESSPEWYERQTARDIRHIEGAHLPVTAYRLEGWQWMRPATLEATIAHLHSLGIHPLLYFRSFVGSEHVGTEDSTAFATALEHGYVATTAAGAPYLYEDNFGKPGAVIDFTNPAAVAWWKERILAGLELGADGFMLDFGEQVHADMHFADGETGAQLHNRFPVLVERATREATDAFEAAHPGRQIAFFTRAGYSGSPGSAAYESFNFPGDETTDWSIASGLPSSTPDMLNRGIGGAWAYSTDVGGYWDLGTPPMTDELFLRWAAWAALSPVMRLHGAVLGLEHVPWNLPEPGRTTRAYARLSRLHASAAALIGSLWEQAASTGIPIARPLWLQFPGDPQAASQEQEWMLGPDVLVAPVVVAGASGRDVYFPQGCWRSPATGVQVTGPQSTTVPSAVGDLPFFFRCGTRPFTPPPAFAAGLRHRRR